MVLTLSQANFYNFGYVEHIQGRPSNYKFSEKDFETFFISSVDLIDFLFEAAFSRVTEGLARTAKDELMEALAG